MEIKKGQIYLLKSAFLTQIVFDARSSGSFDLLRDLGELHDVKRFIIISGHRIHAHHHLHFSFAFEKVLEEMRDATVAVRNLTIRQKI